MIANLYRQDFIKPGYTIQASFHYDKDDPSFQYDTDNFLVRPAPIGKVMPHSIRAYYYGLTGDGHFGKLNVTHAFYQVLGTDKFNEIAGQQSQYQRADGGCGTVAGQRLDALPALVLLRLRRQGSPRRHRARLRHHLRQSELRRRLFQLLGSRRDPADQHRASAW